VTQPAIYIRWSTDDQSTGTTLEVQREGCMKWLASKGLSVTPEFIFVDEGVSGAKVSRPALNRLNRLIEQGLVSLVVVYKLDRLSRRTGLSYRLVEETWQGKADLVSATEPHIDTTTTPGKLGFGIAAVFAAHERDTIRDRTMSGKHRRAQEGRNPGLKPSFGYTIRDKQFVIVEDEAAVVRRIYADYLNGVTDGRLARRLNDSGFRTRQGGPWHISGVQRILTNPVYKGTLTYRDTVVDNAFPAIIEACVWNQAQALRSARSKTHPRRIFAESPYILSGRLVCSKCQRPMNGRVCRNGKYENRYYVCTGYIQFRDCDCLSVRQEVLEEAVMKSLLPLLDEAEVSRRITARLGTTVDQLRHEVAGLESRLRELDLELGRIRQDYRRAKLDVDAFNELRTDIDLERQALTASLMRTRSKLDAAELDFKLDIDVQRAVSLLGTWEALSFAQKKQVVNLLTEMIEWNYHTKTLMVHTVV
jgi:site-specific DNA recombinase